MVKRFCSLGSAVVIAVGMAACGRSQAAETRPATTGDAAFAPVVHDILADYYRRNPTFATALGIHDYDSKLEDYSSAAVAVEIRTVRGFRSRLEALDPSAMSLDVQLDREWLLHNLDHILLQDEVIKPWETDPDRYSSGITNSAYTLMERDFAPEDTRLRALVSRLRLMPAVLADARRNLRNPPKIYVEIAIEQLDGDIDFFKNAVPQAFADVTDPKVSKAFASASADVVTALGEYKTWLQQDLLPQSTGSFAYGAATYQKALWNDEMIDTPLDELLSMARADLAKNQKAFAEAARAIDPRAKPADVLAELQRSHPPVGELLSRTQDQLDGLETFIEEHQIVTIPEAARATVKETPPFMRATTSASMDIPGPFETHATEAYYNMTLPDPAWPAKEQDEFMGQWYDAAVSNVSTHEVWPGHYLQFLYGKNLTSDVRKVFTANSNTEGWAHYVEAMMIEEGLHADDPRYHLAQLQDALLRDVRFIAGIEMHTQGLSVDDATTMFEREAYQPVPVAESEAKRGTSDATYGYYTMGKLMILKLRADYKAKMGPAYTLEGFHDAFIKVGGLPLPLVRRAMLGSVGQLF